MDETRLKQIEALLDHEVVWSETTVEELVAEVRRLRDALRLACQDVRGPDVPVDDLIADYLRDAERPSSAQDGAYSVQGRPDWWDVLAPDGRVVSTWNDPTLAAQECRWLNEPAERSLQRRASAK